MLNVFGLLILYLVLIGFVWLLVFVIFGYDLFVFVGGFEFGCWVTDLVYLTVLCWFAGVVGCMLLIVSLFCVLVFVICYLICLLCFTVV